MGGAGGRRRASRHGGWVGYEEAAPEARAPLTRRRVVETAVALVDRHGLAALSIRQLAAELGVTPMAIYGHVASKEHLLDLMLDLVLGEVELSVAGRPRRRRDPLRAVRAVVVQFSEVFERHPGMARIYGGTVRVGPNGLRAIDAVLSHLLAAGLEPEDAAAAFLALYTFTVGHHQIGGVAAAGDVLAQLPAEQVPHAAAAGPLLFTGPSRSERFEHGLDLLLDGLRASLA